MILMNQNLEAFISVVEAGSISSAAGKINLSQSAVTQRIKLLETTLKVTLFTRSKIGMTLTSEGLHLLHFCRSCVEKEGQLISQLYESGKSSQVNIKLTCPDSLISGRLIKQCKKLYTDWPELNLSFLADSHANRLLLLKKGSVDFAILRVHEVSNQFDSKKISPLEYKLIGPFSWKNRTLVEILKNERYLAYYERDEVSLEYLKKYNLLDRLGRQILYVNDSKSILKMAEYGLGFGLVSTEQIQGIENSKSICFFNEEKSLKISLALAWYRRDELSPHLKELISSIH